MEVEMDNNDILLVISGEERQIISKKIIKIINKEFDYDPRLYTKISEYNGANIKAIDPVSLGALIIAIPAAIVAVADIIERIKNKKKLENVVNQSREIIVERKEISVKIIYPNGMVKDIQHSQSKEISKL